MPSNLIQTKLLIPPLRQSLVQRPHLVEQLNSGLERNLVLVSAPAGYGKSTLLSEWVHRVSLPVAWLSLEKSDNTLSRFWAYFTAALQTIPGLRDGHIGEDLLDLESVSLASSPDDALTHLVDDLAHLHTPFVLVLDDLHVITDPAIHSGLTFLLEHLFASLTGMRLVIASRQDPPWPLARMRARDQVTELRARDLRFTPDETAAFLNHTMGLKLSTSDVALLDQRTEGWIAGLQMAALSMQKREDVSSFLEKFSGSHRFVLDYLIEEVLDRQTPKSMEFLLKTSILDRLTASLCDALVGESGSQEVLNQLEQSNVFLVPLDDEQRWYRYHHLFGDLLRKRLLTSQEVDVPVLHSRASEWYEANGFLRESIFHALEADDSKRVARLVSGNILILVEAEDLSEVLERFHPQKMEEICSRPWLCLSLAWAKAYAAQMDEAELILDRMEASLPGKVSEDERAHLMGHGLTIRAYVQWLKGNFEKAVEISHEALSRIPPDDALERANILIILGLAIQNEEDHQVAVQVFRDAASISTRASNSYLYIYASSCLVYSLKGIGRLHEAVQICNEIEKMASQSGEEYYVLAISFAAKAEILRLWNELEESLISAQKAVALAEKWKQADTLHYSLTVLIDAHLALENFAEAKSLIQRSKWIAGKVSDWFMTITEFQEAKLNFASGNLDLFLQWRQRRCSIEVTSATYYPLLGRYLMLKKDYPEALKLLDEGITRLKAAGLWGRMIELYLMRAVAFSMLGKKEKALSSLRTGLKMAEPEGYVWLFVIQGKPLVGLLREAVRSGTHKEYARKILGIMQAEQSKAAQKNARGHAGKPVEGADHIEPLSDRELEVLRMLNSKLSVPEIANELMVAPSTARTHIRVIYSKLGVHGRLEAIQKAKDQGLI